MNQDILFATGECVLGVVLAATSERGVCAILLGNDPGDLERELRERFPQAARGSGLEPLVAKVAAFVAKPATGLDVSLDLRGGEFQLRVWRALQEIPAGSTETYSEVAARVGAPGSAKEVGEACAANVLAVAIPCHRVLRKDGGLAGYRWGVGRKRALLHLERS
ncbi:MAG TPA: methylated-DNA--[protein]-cysteine S-methyltransferase [Burkholderiales bacterium]|nr:methylated-DNA--[protein]-cysteine S-methyltransferase [Burkholderiales bacterium]